MNEQRTEATLTGRSVRLRAIDAADYEAFRRAELASPLAFRWRLAGQSVSPEQYPETLWNGVLVAFAFEAIASSAGVGMVSAYGADPRHGFVYLAATRLRSFGGPLRDSMCSVEAVTLFIDYLFQGWNFRKVYLECADYNVPQFGSFLERCNLESRLKDHLFLGDRYWDLSTWSIWRGQWPKIRGASDLHVS